MVLEARDRVGGACTLEETWPGYRISPCAYLAGLLHPLVTLHVGSSGLIQGPLPGLPVFRAAWVQRLAGGSVPWFTTRAEVSRELVRSPGRVVLGIPPGALASGHIRYHAHYDGVPVHATLVGSCQRARVA